jgi:hypothetical protein
MNIKRLLHTPLGQGLISIILGIGLATMFRQVCHGKNCINFNGPVISELDGQIYQFNDLCYRYKTKPVKCDAMKKQIEIKDPNKDELF